MKYVFWYSPLLPETFIQSKENWAVYYHKRTSIFKFSARIPCRLQLKFSFSTDFSQNTQISNFMKIGPVAAEFFHVDG